jgi:hypothetical protein
LHTRPVRPRGPHHPALARRAGVGRVARGEPRPPVALTGSGEMGGGAGLAKNIRKRWSPGGLGNRSAPGRFGARRPRRSFSGGSQRRPCRQSQHTRSAETPTSRDRTRVLGQDLNSSRSRPAKDTNSFSRQHKRDRLQAAYRPYGYYAEPLRRVKAEMALPADFSPNFSLTRRAGAGRWRSSSLSPTG